MNGATMVGIVGGLTVWLTLTDRYLIYVKAGMRPWLMLAGIGLLVVAADRLWRARRAPAHGHTPAVAWLLLVPVAFVGVLRPDPLGAFSARRETANQVRDFGVAPLPPPRDGAIDVNIADFLGRTRNFPATVDGVPIRVLGFVAHDGADGFLLTRFWLSCCAADSFPVQVRVTGVEPPKANTWVEVVGVWRSGAGDTPTLAASSVTPTARPANPYAN